MIIAQAMKIEKIKLVNGFGDINSIIVNIVLYFLNIIRWN